MKHEATMQKMEITRYLCKLVDLVFVLLPCITFSLIILCYLLASLAFGTISKYVSSNCKFGFGQLVMSFVFGIFSDRGRLLSLARTHWSPMWCSTVRRCKMDKSIIFESAAVGFFWTTTVKLFCFLSSSFKSLWSICSRSCSIHPDRVARKLYFGLISLVSYQLVV